MPGQGEENVLAPGGLGIEMTLIPGGSFRMGADGRGARGRFHLTRA
jgi:hypothetical protein